MEKDINTDKEIKEKEVLEELIKRNRFSIDVDYIDIGDEDIARVVKVGNSFTVYLAKSLRDSIFTKSGDYNYAVINKIRKLMSHELGHLILHTKDLLSDDSLQGSLDIKDEEKELEANLFSEELLELRRVRNKTIRLDGGADKLL